MHPSRPALLALLLCTRLHATPVPLLVPSADDPVRARAWRLDNGLEVWLSVNPELPQFYAEIAVRAGSKNDPPDCTGLAHYLEHLLFKGTTRLGTLDFARERPLLDRVSELYERHFQETDPARRAEIYALINSASAEAAALAVPNEFDTLYTSMGATDINAHTSVEETVYKVALPSSRLRAWARVEADRFAHPVFRLFHTELETVYEEKNRSLDDRNSLLYEAADRRLFPLHPYGSQTTLGEAEHLKRPSLVRIQQFFDAWYVPGNMAIFLSGDLDPEETLRVLDEAFSAWPAKPTPDPTLWIDPGPRGVERVTVTYPGQESVQIAYRTVPAGHPDEDALVLLDLLLDNQVAGLINLNLNQAQRVQQAGSYPQFMRDAGVHRLWGVPKDGQTPAEVEKLLLEQIALVREGAFDEALLPAILADLRRSEMREIEGNQGRVARMRDAYILGRPWSSVTGRIDRLARVGKADIVRAAQRHFSGPRVVAEIRDGPRVAPSLPKPAIDPLEIPESRSAFGAEILALPAAAPALRPLREPADYQSAGNDARRLVRAPNPMNGLFSLAITLEVGSADLPLLPLALRLAEKCGVPGIPADRLPLAWYKLGAEWSHEVDRHQTTLTLTGLDASFDQALDLLTRQLQDPRPESGTWPALRGIVGRERADARKDPDTVFQALVEFHARGTMSSYLRQPRLVDLEALGDRALLAVIPAALGRPSQAAFTGALALDDLAARLGGGLLPPLEESVSHLRPTAPLRVPATNEVWWVRQDTAQTTLRISVADGAPAEARVAPAQAFNRYFGSGMASLVFQQIREARALAYSAWAAYVPARIPMEENVFVAELGTQCDKTIDALDALAGLIRAMPLSADRFGHARDGVVHQYLADPPGFREIPGLVLRWNALGLAADPRPARLRQLEDLTVNEIATFMRERVVARPWLISLCGDAAAFDAAALARFGAVREVRVEELFPE